MKPFLKFSLAGAALALAFAAQATPGGEGDNTGCNGVGNANSPCTGTGNTGGTGGAGGQGGAGGTGIGVGIAVAQANAAAVAAANASANAAANQVQGQQQGQSQSSRNTNTATGGAGGRATATGGNSGGNTLSTGAVAVTVEGSKGDTYIAPAQERNPVATAYAAPLTSSPETCMGSSSGGVQGGAIGISVATTWESVKCDRRMFARALDSLGMRKAALALLCLDADVASAMKAAELSCPGAEAKRAESILNGEPQPVAQRRQAMPWQAGG